ncbi:MAG: hypothetical protein K2N98_00005 [Lachnospiraceae bacterium]|nr:hypothetical protein [Lachnospiraceae bacterium]
MAITAMGIITAVTVIITGIIVTETIITIMAADTETISTSRISSHSWIWKNRSK